MYTRVCESLCARVCAHREPLAGIGAPLMPREAQVLNLDHWV